MEASSICGTQVILRPLKQTYFYDYLTQLSLPVCNALHITHIDYEFQYLEQCVEKINLNLTFFYCVFDQATNTLIGAIEIRREPSSAGQLYCWLNHHWWGQGKFCQAIQLAAQNYFNVTGQKTFNAHVYLENQRSYYALKKCGFVDAGFFNGSQGAQFNLVLNRKTIL